MITSIFDTVPRDPEATAIGLLYQKAKLGSPDNPFQLNEIGNRLITKKESLGHGQWLPWLKANEGVLGFAAPMARSLMFGAQWCGSNWQLILELEDLLTDPHATREALSRAGEIRRQISKHFQPILRGTLGRRHNEWYTPGEVIKLARAVMGDIDMDPASSEIAQQTVRARRYFNKDQNGLRQEWNGRVWLNPPYVQPLIDRFIAKLLMEWRAKRISACIALTNNFTDTAWFQDAASHASAICFTQGRIIFCDPDGELGRPTQGQSYFYFGSDREAFSREFSRVGMIVRPETGLSLHDC